jgi:hypothetical protein
MIRLLEAYLAAGDAAVRGMFFLGVDGLLRPRVMALQGEPTATFPSDSVPGYPSGAKIMNGEKGRKEGY